MRASRRPYASEQRVSDLESVLTCPECGLRKQETMPVDACQFYYDCTACKTVLRPRPGDCCVFCSYGSVKCPPMQKHPA